MPNLRVVHDNAARRSTITASSQAGSLTADRLKSDRKTRVWRSVGTTATLTVVFDTAEPVECFALPFCNLTSTATVRVRGYANLADTIPVIDTGTNPACPYIPFDEFEWGVQPLGVNAFSFGEASECVVWFDAQVVKKLVIDLIDTDNAAGYIEASCMVAGTYWSPKINAQWGAGLVTQDLTKNERSESGNLRSDIGTKSKKLSFDLRFLDPADRNRLWNIMLGNGLAHPVFISMFPESTDVVEEQMHQIYGKLTQQSKIAAQSFGTSQAPFEVEGV